MSVQVKVTRRSQNGQDYFEGTVSIAKLKPTKLVRTDGSTLFQTRSALTSAIKSLERSLGQTVETDDSALQRAAKRTSGSKSTS